MAFGTCLSVFAQDVYFKAGQNHTKYKYTSDQGVKNRSFAVDLGSAYELGYSFPFTKINRLSYDVALTLNEYNAIVGVSQSSLKWKTEYVGIQNSVSFAVLEINRFAVDIKTGLNLSTIIYGKEEINGVVYDLKNLDGFKGLTVQPIFGLEAKFFASKHGYLSLGYTYINSFNKGKNSEKFSFATNQVLLGIHFPIEKTDKKMDKKIE